MSAVTRKPLVKAPARDIVESLVSPQVTSPNFALQATQANSATATDAEPAFDAIANSETTVESAPLNVMATTIQGPRNSLIVAPVTPIETDGQSGPRDMRRGPGRPRSKRRMEPFSTKIEIGLRDSIDDYLAESGGTMVDFLDAALREHLIR